MKQSNFVLRKYPIIGVCGLDCGLCPRYYTVGSSRCPGCGGPDFFNKHPSCLNFIKEYGIEKFVEQQKKRIKLLEMMIENFDDGRSKSFFCKAAALLGLTGLSGSLEKAIQKTKAAKIKQNDVKNKAKILKEILNEIALKEGVELIKKRQSK